MAKLPSKGELIMHISSNSIQEIINVPSKSIFGKSGKTILHLAAKYSPTPDLIQDLVNIMKLKPSKTTQNLKKLAVHIASKHGKLENVQKLVALWPKSIESKDFAGNTPLAVACKYNQYDIAYFFVSNGADLYKKNKSKQIPIQLCAKFGHFSIFALLANLLDSQVWTCIYKNCLQLTIEEGHKELASFILEKSEFKEKCVFQELYNILKSCKSEEMAIVVLECVKERNMSRLVILLTLEISSKTILKYCESELRSDAVYISVIYDRPDLLLEMYYARILKAKDILEISNENLREKCLKFLNEFRRWQNCKTMLFTKKYCKKDCIKRLPNSLVQDVLTYI
jgi:ankyrin repeat protein